MNDDCVDDDDDDDDDDDERERFAAHTMMRTMQMMSRMQTPTAPRI